MHVIMDASEATTGSGAVDSSTHIRVLQGDTKGVLLDLKSNFRTS